MWPRKSLNLLRKPMTSNTITYEYFVSGRWRDQDKLFEICDVLDKAGKSYYCFLKNAHTNELLNVSERSDDVEKVMSDFEARKDWRNDPVIAEIFQQDMEGLRACENLLVLLPAGKSVHIEAGAAYGMGKPCIAIGEQKETESLYMIFDNIFPTLDDFAASLKGGA